MPADFDKQEYWHHRFAHEPAFEWLVPSRVFMAILAPYLAQLDQLAAPPRILQLGCGTSDLHTHLRARGFAAVTNLDYAPLAVARGAHLERAAFGDVRMRYCVADATQQLPQDLGQSSFHLVVDKSTVDAVACGGDEAVLRMARGVRRVLDPAAGVWLSLSYSSSRFDGLAGLLPFHVRVVDRVPTPKLRDSDPDVYYYAYLLWPKDAAA